MKLMRVTVSGSFHRHLHEIQEDVEALVDLGMRVLSPADPRVVDGFGDFLFVASDQVRAIRGVQSRHLLAIGSSDFLWLVNPDGYVGPSAAMEVGFAVAIGTPILSLTPPSDLTLRQYVEVVGSIKDAAKFSSNSGPNQFAGAILLDPIGVSDQLHATVDKLERQLTSEVNRVGDEELVATMKAARSLLQLP